MARGVAFFAAVTVALACPAIAAVPDMTCHAQIETQISPITLDGKLGTPREVYRFSNGDLFISRPDRGEYRYNKVTEVEPGRYTSGHKTLILSFPPPIPGTERLLVVHSDVIDIRVTVFACTREHRR